MYDAYLTLNSYLAYLLRALLKIFIARAFISNCKISSIKSSLNLEVELYERVLMLFLI